jgi:hypothetical protein
MNEFDLFEKEHANPCWVVSYVHCEKRPTNAIEEFLLVNFPGVPINKCSFHRPQGSSNKEVVDAFNETWKDKFNIYAIGAKLTPDL